MLKDKPFNFDTFFYEVPTVIFGIRTIQKN